MCAPEESAGWEHRKQKEVMFAQYATPIKNPEEDDRLGKDEHKEEEWVDANESQWLNAYKMLC